MSNLFTYKNAPFLVYIDKTEPNFQYYVGIIESNGGIVTNTKPADSNVIFYMSSKAVPGVSPVYKTKFIEDCIKAGKFLNLQDYEYKVVRSISPNPKKASRYTKEEDEYIMEQVRLNPLERGSHRFFEMLSKHEQLKHHSFQSVRSRYRKYLAPKLEYCYKVDKEGTLILDHNKRKIRVPMENAPDRKTKYTALDDYVLCLEVAKYVSNGLEPKRTAKSPANFDHVPEHPQMATSFFKDVMYQKYRQHSHQSWRDRYRKFAIKFGVRKYLQYYEHSVALGSTPEPMRLLAKDVGLVDVVLGLVGSNYDERVNVPLDEEISQVKDSTVGSRNGQSGNSLVQRPVLDTLNEDDDIEDDESDLFVEAESHLDPDSSRISQTKSQAKKEQARAEKEQARAEKEQARIEKEKAKSQKEAQKKAKAEEPKPRETRRKSQRQAQKQAQKQAPAEVAESAPKAAETVSTENTSNTEPQVKEEVLDDQYWEIGYISPRTPLGDIVDPQFFSNILGVSSALEEAYHRTKDLGLIELCRELLKTPLRKALVMHIVKTCGTDADRIREYNKLWLTQLMRNAGLMDDALEFLTVYDVRGIWNEEYDNQLRIETQLGRKSRAIAFMTKQDKEERVEFLKSIDDF